MTVYNTLNDLNNDGFPLSEDERQLNEAVQVVYTLARRIEAMKAIVQRHLQEVVDDQNTVKRMNKNRIGDKSHEKYQPEIDRLTTILHEIEQLKGGS
jgi:GTPase